MSFSAYRERQDRTFDTFRSKFGIVRNGTHGLVSQTTNNLDASARDSVRARAMSSATCRDILVNISDYDEDIGHDKETERVVFAPQIRRLDIAPWEDEALREELSPRQEKKPRSSILSKFRRKSSRTSRLGETDTSLQPCSPNLSISPTPSSPSTPHTAIFRDDPVSEHSLSASTNSEPSIGFQSKPSVEPECDIKFLPVDPNIVHLRRPISVIHEDGEIRVIKPSNSTPQIQHELFEIPQRTQDRMSRMFDGLKFN